MAWLRLYATPVDQGGRLAGIGLGLFMGGVLSSLAVSLYPSMSRSIAAITLSVAFFGLALASWEVYRIRKTRAAPGMKDRFEPVHGPV